MKLVFPFSEEELLSIKCYQDLNSAQLIDMSLTDEDLKCISNNRLNALIKQIIDLDIDGLGDEAFSALNKVNKQFMHGAPISFDLPVKEKQIAFILKNKEIILNAVEKRNKQIIDAFIGIDDTTVEDFDKLTLLDEKNQKINEIKCSENYKFKKREACKKLFQKYNKNREKFISLIADNPNLFYTDITEQLDKLYKLLNGSTNNDYDWLIQHYFLIWFLLLR